MTTQKFQQKSYNNNTIQKIPPPSHPPQKSTQIAPFANSDGRKHSQIIYNL